MAVAFAVPLAVDKGSHRFYRRAMMNWLSAIWTTIGAVSTGVFASAVVVFMAWLIGYYGPDRVLQVSSYTMVVVGILSLLSLYFLPKR